MAVSVTSSPRLLRREPGRLERRLDERRRRRPPESCLPERLTQVTKPSRQEAVAAASGGLPARLAQHELAERQDQPGRLGDRDEARRAGRAAGRRGPAQERLDADDLADVEVDLRLVVDGELAALEAEPQLVLEPEQLAELAGHLVAEDLVAAAAGLLGRVHRDVGVAGSAPRCSPVRRGGRRCRCWRRARARGRRRRAGSARRSSSRPAIATALPLVRALEEQRELVAAEPGERVARADDRRRSAAATAVGAAGRRRRGRGCR